MSLDLVIDFLNSGDSEGRVDLDQVSSKVAAVSPTRKLKMNQYRGVSKTGEDLGRV